MSLSIKRGDVLLVDFASARGSEQGKTRPAVVVQNDIGNKYSSTTIVVPVTSRIKEKNYPTDVIATAEEMDLQKDGTINCAQVATISIENRVIKKLGTLKQETLRKVDEALKTSLGLD